ncbi:MAG: DUF1846 domain-containing protein [Fibrobacterota bacterium]
MKKGFDNEKYLDEQTKSIVERADRFQNKLYLEFGGKLLFDYHAKRILPGYDPNVKMRLLQRLKDRAEIVVCIFAGDIERKKMRADFGISYDADALKLIDELKEWGLSVAGVVVTRYNHQPAARLFIDRLERRHVRVYTHKAIPGYPADVNTIVSDNGYGINPYIETEKPIVVVTGPGPGSGKMATCLSQIYHDHVKGVNSGYAKFETFPIWNLPLKHPVNIAYEAATADLGDFNQIDPFQLEAFGETTINYNRDVEVFPVVRRILERIMGSEKVYKSPTDMGVNRAGFAIVDDEVVREASRQEVLRRWFRYSCEYMMGLASKETVDRAEIIMQGLGLSPEDRPVVKPARAAAAAAEVMGKGNAGTYCGAAILLRDGTIITGKNSPLMHAAAACVLNAVKRLAGLPDPMHLLSPGILESIGALKKNILKSKQISLNLDEALIALSIGATTNPAAQMALEKVRELEGCEIHMTHIPAPGDEAGLRKLGMNLTSDPNFSGTNLYVP